MIGGVATLTALVLVVLSNRWLELWQLSAAQGTFSMAPGLPACHGLWLREGFTYLFRDPHRGEIVTFRARGHRQPRLRTRSTRRDHLPCRLHPLAASPRRRARLRQEREAARHPLRRRLVGSLRA